MDLQNKNNSNNNPWESNDTSSQTTQNEPTTEHDAFHPVEDDAQYPDQRVFEQPSDIASDRMDTQPRPLNPEQSYHTNTGAQQSFDPNAQQPMNQPSHPAYATYQEWMHQEDKRAAKHARKLARAERRKNRKFGRKPVLIAGSIAAACVLLVGGIAIGSSMSGGADNNSSSVSATSVNSNLPSVNISSPTTTSNSTNDGLSGEEIYAKVSPSVVSIQAVNLTSGEGGTGSGVIMSADGYIITNNHVVVDENTGVQQDKITVYMSDGTSFPAEVIGLDEQTDLAVLKIDPAGTTLTPAEFGDSNSLLVGEEVYAIGSPGGLDLANTITGGHISALNRDITIDDRVMSLIQTDAAINPGNSGGALINKYGQVIGITSAKLGISYYEGLGFAIPMDTVKPIVDELIQNGYIAGRPQIGISGQNVSEQQSAAYGIPQGVRVINVDSRSNAAAAGVQANDIITGINGTEVTDMDGVNAVKDELSAGDKITLTLYRMSTGKTFTVSFALNDQHDLQGDDPALSQESEQSQYSQGQDGQQYYNQNPFNYFFGW
ncbi:MAG TPA: trypsin-like peptidase domain-containing protein [Butyricicoccus pullicaecorum]|nr:trypsin-like peptidase domain-containing protein [Butyricicoccus pullicaecorum]